MNYKSEHFLLQQENCKLQKHFRGLKMYVAVWNVLQNFTDKGIKIFSYFTVTFKVKKNTEWASP